jgi:hypothetical protein
MTLVLAVRSLVAPDERTGMLGKLLGQDCCQCVRQSCFIALWQKQAQILALQTSLKTVRAANGKQVQGQSLRPEFLFGNGH